MFKPLIIISLSIFFGWALNALIQIFLFWLNTTKIIHWFVGFYAGIPVNIASACNYYVIYFLSKDYRLVFKIQLEIIRQIFCQKLNVYKKRLMIRFRYKQRQITTTI